MNGLPWFRMYVDAVDDEKLRLLAFEDRWHFVALLCCKARGLLDNDDDAVMRHRKLAVKLGLQLRELEAMGLRLSEVGLIDPDTFDPYGWDQRQFKSDTDPTAADRKRRQRERQQHNETASRVTPVTVTRTDTDTDTDTDKKKAGANARGARLPKDWKPSDENIAYATEKMVDWKAQAEAFKDHWAAAAGSKGVKLDWDATWRTWIRRSPRLLPAALPSVPRKPAGPSETKLERDVAYARHQFSIGAIDAAERDRLIAAATDKHREKVPA